MSRPRVMVGQEAGLDIARPKLYKSKLATLQSHQSRATLPHTQPRSHKNPHLSLCQHHKMQFSMIIASIAALGLGAVNAAAIDKRLPRFGAFGYFPVDGCPANQEQVYEFTYGNDCGHCNNFYNNTVMKSINVFGQINDGKCIITVHNTFDCSDPGTVSGPGCWSPEGGVAGWTITCPWEDPTVQFPVCRA